MAELTEGESYLIRVTITNQSVRAGDPVEATFEMVTYGDGAVVYFYPSISRDEYFSAGETRTFDYPLDIPLGYGGQSGRVWAVVRDPAGVELARASEYITIGLVRLCTEGETKCVGYDLHVCVNGEWVLEEINSLECGYPEPCTEGETKCVGYDLHICHDGEWVLLEENSAACGYIPPPPEPDIILHSAELGPSCWGPRQYGGYAVFGVIDITIQNNGLPIPKSDVDLQITLLAGGGQCGFVRFSREIPSGTHTLVLDRSERGWGVSEITLSPDTLNYTIDANLRLRWPGDPSVHETFSGTTTLGVC